MVSDRHLTLKVERDYLRKTKITFSSELDKIEKESLSMLKKTECIRMRVGRVARLAQKDLLRRPKLESLANSAFLEAEGLRVARDRAKAECIAHLSTKAKSGDDYQQLRIHTTTAEQVIIERKLLLGRAQDEAMELHSQTKAAEALASRRIDVDLPAAKCTHADLRATRDLLKARVKGSKRSDKEASSDIEMMESVLYSVLHDVEIKRVQSVYAVDALSTVLEAFNYSILQGNRNEAIAAISLAYHATNSQDATFIAGNLMKRLLATIGQVQALEWSQQELASCFNIARVRSDSKLITATIAADRFYALSLEHLEADLAACKVTETSMQIQTNDISYQSTSLTGDARKLQTMAANVGVNIDNERLIVGQTRGEIGRDLIYINNMLWGPLSRLDDVHCEVARCTSLTKGASISTSMALWSWKKAALEVTACSDGADAAHFACLAVLRFFELAKAEHSAACSIQVTTECFVMKINAAIKTKQDNRALVGCNAIGAEVDATLTKDSLVQKEFNLFAVRQGKHCAQRGNHVNAGVRLAASKSGEPCEDAYDSSREMSVAQFRRHDKNLLSVLGRLLDAQRQQKLARESIVRLICRKDQYVALNTATEVEQSRLASSFGKIVTLQLLLFSKKKAMTAVRKVQSCNRAYVKALERLEFALKLEMTEFYAELIAAEVACRAHANLMDTPDFPVVSYLSFSFGCHQLCHYVFELTGVLRGLKIEETEVRVELDDISTRLSDKAVVSSSLCIKLERYSAKREFLDRELEAILKTIARAKANMTMLEHRRREAESLLDLGTKSLYFEDVSYMQLPSCCALTTTGLISLSKNSHSKRWSSTDALFDLEDGVKPLTMLLRDAAGRLCRELKDEEARHDKLASTVRTLRQDSVHYLPLACSLATASITYEATITDIEAASLYMHRLDATKASLAGRNASGVETRTSAKSKMAAIRGSLQASQASLVVTCSHVNRSAAEASETCIVAKAAEKGAVQANANLDRQRLASVWIYPQASIAHPSIKRMVHEIINIAGLAANRDRQTLASCKYHKLADLDIATQHSNKTVHMRKETELKRRDAVDTQRSTLWTLHRQHTHTDNLILTLQNAIVSASHSSAGIYHVQLSKDPPIAPSVCSNGDMISKVRFVHAHKVEPSVECALGRHQLFQLRHERGGNLADCLRTFVCIRTDVNLACGRFLALQKEIDLIRKLEVYSPSRATISLR